MDAGGLISGTVTIPEKATSEVPSLLDHSVCVYPVYNITFAAQSLLCAVGLFAHSELSHTQRTRSLLAAPTFPPCPTRRQDSLRAPRGPHTLPLFPLIFSPPPPSYVPRSLSVPTARLSCGPWGRRLTPQVD